MLEHLLDVALFSLRMGGSNLEEPVLSFELELSCFSHGLEPCFGVYSGVQVITGQGGVSSGLFNVVGCQGWVWEFQASHVAFSGCVLVAVHCDDVALRGWKLHSEVDTMAPSVLMDGRPRKML